MPEKKSTVKQGSEPDYREFLRSVKLYIIALDEISTKINRDAYWERSKDEKAIVRTINAAYKADDVDGGHFDVLASFTIKLAARDDDSSLLTLTCKYRAHFHANFDIKDSFAERFAKSEAKIVIWPYFRQLVSDVTGRMYIPPVIVPLTLDTV